MNGTAKCASGISGTSYASPDAVICQNQTINTGIGLQMRGSSQRARINLNVFDTQVHGIYLGYDPGTGIIGTDISSNQIPNTPGDNVWVNNLAGSERLFGYITLSPPPNNTLRWFYNQSGAYDINLYAVSSVSPFLYNFLPQSVLPPYQEPNCFTFSIRSTTDEIENLDFLYNTANQYVSNTPSDTLKAVKMYNDLFFLQEFERQDSLIHAMVNENDSL